MIVVIVALDFIALVVDEGRVAVEDRASEAGVLNILRVCQQDWSLGLAS